MVARCWDLSGLGITQVPPSLCALPFPTDLNLRDNNITSLPACWGRLTVGGSLDLSDNALSTLPPGLARLGESVGGTIFLGGNPIAAVPEASFSRVAWEGYLSDKDSDKGNDTETDLADMTLAEVEAIGIWPEDLE